MNQIDQADFMNGVHRMRGAAMANGIRLVFGKVQSQIQWMRWNGEIAMTSRRLGPVAGARGPAQ